MHQHLRVLTLLGIFCLTLFSLAGCGEKRLHVSTASGAPGEEIALEPIEEMTSGQPDGLGTNLVDESNLSSQIPHNDATSGKPLASAVDTEPIDMAHEPTNLPAPEASQSEDNLPSLESELADISSPADSLESELADNTDPLANGQDFAAQSSSSSGGVSPNSASTSPGAAHNLSAGLQDALSGEGIEPVPDQFQIAKAEPSGNLEDRMNRIKAEELAAAAAGLEDVFFQFDSWTLTQEGKQTLERTVKWFTQDPSSNLIVEGHADQRGTQAYNMVLAKKRAVAVQEYLSQLGVEPSRIGIIAYGKDKPFCLDATEVCYQLNRRGHLLVQNP